MKQCSLEPSETSVFRSEDGACFIFLGKSKPTSPSRGDQAKVRGETPDIQRRFWATLGMVDDSPPIWRGQLKYSESGNLSSVRKQSSCVTCDEIDRVYECRSDQINQKPSQKTVTERFISFEDVSFPDFPDTFSPEQIPMLRLTLMLPRDHGAIVFYQFDKERKRRKTTDRRTDTKDDGSALEYILPRPTIGHDCSSRDRLSYHIPVLPPKVIEPVEKSADRFRLGRRRPPHNFLIKILTFHRENSQSSTIVGRLRYHLFGHTHQLLLWDNQTGAFTTIDPSALDPAKKTLFLIHGTFSSTTQAFRGLIDGGRTSWIGRKYGAGPRQFEQIFGFDHPSFSEGPRENVQALLERLGTSFHFERSINIITHSRGGLVGKYLAINSPQIPISRGAFVACANGVGYFTAGAGVAKFLSVGKLLAKYSGRPELALITGLAQHSAEFFLSLPGSQAMTPGSDRLRAIAEVQPRFTPNARYLPIIGDFDRTVMSGENLVKRWGAGALDLLIKPFLGKYHDWVVGTPQQYIMPPGTYPTPPPIFSRNVFNPPYRPKGFKPHRLSALHNQYFHRRAVKDALNTFFN